MLVCEVCTEKCKEIRMTLTKQKDIFMINLSYGYKKEQKHGVIYRPRMAI